MHPLTQGSAPPRIARRTIEVIFDKIKNNRKIEAIKDIRQLTNLGLKESKDIADRSIDADTLTAEFMRVGMNVEGAPLEQQGMVPLLAQILEQIIEQTQLLKDLMEVMSE